MPLMTRSPESFRRFEQRGRGAGEVGAEGQRGGGAVRSQPADELACDLACISHVGHAHLFRQRAVLQPVEQRASQTPQHAHLGKMRVRVHQAGQQEAAA